MSELGPAWAVVHGALPADWTVMRRFSFVRMRLATTSVPYPANEGCDAA